MVENDENKKYTYFAFISYKSENSDWARWLRRKLQTYRLPFNTHRKHKGISNRCSPVFLDKFNLRPGYLNEGLRSEVQDARYLIVLCSEEAHDKSEYIDAEIKFFLDGGGDPSRIVPFVINESKNPEEECYPLRLQELYKEGHDLHRVDAFGKNRDRAFLDSVAYMHGIDTGEMLNDDRRRSMTVRILLVAAAVLAIFAGYRIRDYYRIKTRYYLDYTEIYGVPKGIVELDKHIGVRYPYKKLTAA